MPRPFVEPPPAADPLTLPSPPAGERGKLGGGGPPAPTLPSPVIPGQAREGRVIQGGPAAHRRDLLDNGAGARIGQHREAISHRVEAGLQGQFVP